MHRGRFQSQGGNVEESENWSQENPLTKVCADQKLQNLKNKSRVVFVI